MRALDYSDVETELNTLGETGSAKLKGSDLYTRREENADWMFIGRIKETEHVAVDALIQARIRGNFPVHERKTGKGERWALIHRGEGYIDVWGHADSAREAIQHALSKIEFPFEGLLEGEFETVPCDGGADHEITANLRHIGFISLQIDDDGWLVVRKE